MAIHANGIRHGLTLGGFTFNVELYSDTPITNGIILLTSDGDILKDDNGIYATSLNYLKLTSVDNTILKDLNDLYLITKESE